MAYRLIPVQIRQSARRMRLDGETLHKIAAHLNVDMTSVYKWTRDIPHPNRMSDHNMILNARNGVVCRINAASLKQKFDAQQIKKKQKFDAQQIKMKQKHDAIMNAMDILLMFA